MPRRPIVSIICLTLACTFCLAMRPGAIQAQQRDSVAGDSLRSYVLRLHDGSVIIGKLIAETNDSVTFQMTGGRIVVARANITDVRTIAPRSVRNGEYWVPDPNDTRLFFAPTGRMLAKGEGYFSDTYLLLLNFVGGVTSRFTMGGGFSIIPSDNPQNNILYITPKFGVLQSERLNIAVGGVAALAGFERIEKGLRNFGILYGVGTVGSPDASVSFGTGLAYTGNGLARSPVYMLGGSVRAGRRASLITENYLFPSAKDHGLVTYGVRFFGEKLSVDLAFGNLVGSESTFIFPGIPYVAVAVKF
jgi:hypothetical protein